MLRLSPLRCEMVMKNVQACTPKIHAPRTGKLWQKFRPMVFWIALLLTKQGQHKLFGIFTGHTFEELLAYCVVGQALVSQLPRMLTPPVPERGNPTGRFKAHSRLGPAIDDIHCPLIVSYQPKQLVRSHAKLGLPERERDESKHLDQPPGTFAKFTRWLRYNTVAQPILLKSGWQFEAQSVLAPLEHGAAPHMHAHAKSRIWETCEQRDSHSASADRAVVQGLF